MTTPIPVGQTGLPLAKTDPHASRMAAEHAGEAALFDVVWLDDSDAVGDEASLNEAVDALLATPEEQLEAIVSIASVEDEAEVPDAFPILLARAGLAEQASAKKEVNVQSALEPTVQTQPGVTRSDQIPLLQPAPPGQGRASEAEQKLGLELAAVLKNGHVQGDLSGTQQAHPLRGSDPVSLPQGSDIETTNKIAVDAIQLNPALGTSNSDTADTLGVNEALESSRKLEPGNVGSEAQSEGRFGDAQAAIKHLTDPGMASTTVSTATAVSQVGLLEPEPEMDPGRRSEPPTEIPPSTPSGSSTVYSAPMAVQSLASRQVSAGSVQSDRLQTQVTEVELEAEISGSAASNDRQATIQTSTHAVLSRPEMPRHIAAQMAQALRGPANGPVEITLQPEELGRVRMTITTSEAGIAINVAAERNETFEMMRRHAASLSKELISLGFESVDLSFEQTDHKGTGSHDPEDRNAGTSSFLEDGPLDAAGLSIELTHRTDLDQTKALDKRI